MMPDQWRKWLRQQSKDSYAAGCTGKAKEHVYQCWWRICREIFFFPGSNITCFRFYIHLLPIFWLFLLFWSRELESVH
jgi:hypothetical protein